MQLGETALMRAARNGHAAAITALLNGGADVDAADDDVSRVEVVRTTHGSGDTTCTDARHDALLHSCSLVRPVGLLPLLVCGVPRARGACW